MPIGIYEVLFKMDWFLYENGLRHERISKEEDLDNFFKYS